MMRQKKGSGEGKTEGGNERKKMLDGEKLLNIFNTHKPSKITSYLKGGLLYWSYWRTAHTYKNTSN